MSSLALSSSFLLLLVVQCSGQSAQTTGKIHELTNNVEEDYKAGYALPFIEFRKFSEVMRRQNLIYFDMWDAWEDCDNIGYNFHGLQLFDHDYNCRKKYYIVIYFPLHMFRAPPADELFLADTCGVGSSKRCLYSRPRSIDRNTILHGIPIELLSSLGVRQNHFDNRQYKWSALVEDKTDMSTCSNGQYAVEEARAFNSFNFVYYPAQCSACQPGTWNTCTRAQSCTFHVKTNVESAETYVTHVLHHYKEDIHPFFLSEGTLIGACYPCAYAMKTDLHYGVIHKYGGDFVQGITTTLPFFCPGGADEPQRCPENSHALVDGRGRATSCSCKPGYYKKVTNAVDNVFQCILCEAGYFCHNDVRTICPVDTYSGTGLSSCLACVTAPCQPPLMRAQCQQGSVRDESQCVSCRQCRNFGSMVEDAKYCYGLPTIELQI